MFPLFKTMFEKCGFNVILSSISDPSIPHLSSQYAMSETCYPVKLIYGHVAWLLEQKVDYILLPRLYTIIHKGSMARKNYACIYMQMEPLMMEEAFHFKNRGVTLISPELSLDFGKQYMINALLSMSKPLGVPKPLMIPAAMAGVKALFAHSERLETLAKDYMDTNEPVFVLVSRVYNIADPALNMGIESYLNSMGCRVIHLEHLEASCMHVEQEYDNLYWPFGQHILTGLEIIGQHENLIPIYITNHGCGPDTAIGHYVKNTLKDRPYLHIEVDEHASRIGLITRLEAFLYSLNRMSHKEEPMMVVRKPKVTLIPELGPYTSLLKELCKDENARCVESLKNHASFNYAMNKEYYSLLVNMEETLNTIKPYQSYNYYFPTYEGSEVYGQYGHLIAQECQRRMSYLDLKAPFIEDYLKDQNIETYYKKMLHIEKTGYECSHDKKIMVIGEPQCVYKTYTFNTNTAYLKDKCDLVRMPLSEALLMFWMDYDRKHEYTNILNKLIRLHNEALKETPDLYTPMQDLMDSIKDKLSFCQGGMGRYRLAKTLCLTKKQMDGILILNSAEENTAIVLKCLMEGAKDKIQLPVCNGNVDFSHALSEEDAENFLYYI